jgi:hypothetical protein
MSEENCKYDNIQDYKTAFECFKQRFLIGKKSIFRLEDNDEILNESSIKYLMDNFVNNGYSGKASFIDKIKSQLTGEEEKDRIVASSKEEITKMVILGAEKVLGNK